MEGIRQYFLTVTAAAIVCAITKKLAGRNGVTSGILKLLTGLFLALCVVSPWFQIGEWNLSAFSEDITLDAEEAVSAGEKMAYESVGSIIKERTEAYILDKAASMDLKIDVEVTLDASDPPQPCALRLVGEVSPYAKEMLSRYIEDTLGVSREDQIWG